MKFAEPGELVNPGMPIYRIGLRGSQLHVLKLGLNDRDVVRIGLGDSATVKFDPYPTRTFQGVVTRLAGSANPRNGTFETEITIIDPPVALKNGFVGRASILPKISEPYLRLPMAALVEMRAQKAIVYTPSENGGQAVEHQLEPLFIGDDYFAVSANGTTPLDRVITDGAAYIRPGGEINILN